MGSVVFKKSFAEKFFIKIKIKHILMIVKKPNIVRIRVFGVNKELFSLFLFCKGSMFAFWEEATTNKYINKLKNCIGLTVSQFY